MKYRLLFAGAAALMLFSGCAKKEEGKGVKLDPENPVTLTVWHYYNGAQHAAFDTLVSEFNALEGKEKGIYVESFSRGSVVDLEQALTDAMEEKVGADPLPDIFSTYSDVAFSLQERGMLANLAQYFTEEETAEYVDAYIEEGRLGKEDELYILPTAKSTEIMMINKTDWEPFAADTGATFEDLSTLEGVVKTAEAYYKWTDDQTPDILDDGKAFYGRDSMSNYFIIGMMQMGTELFKVNDGKVTIQADKEQIHRLWENYYVPYVKGYFTSLGKFRSDDVKTGDLLAYTGSSSSSMYFPDNIVNGEDSIPIEYAILTIPILEGAQLINVQQGAGMAVTKNDEIHEYASSVFLKWFTEEENNLRFVCESSYLPVKKDANTVEALEKIISDNDISISPKVNDVLKSVLQDFQNVKLYTPQCFENGYETRKVLDYNLSDQAAADKSEIDARVEAGEEREIVTNEYISEEAFESWYEQFKKKLTDTSQGL